MNINLFDYHLPKKNIAQFPLEKRDHSRLLVYDRSQTIQHRHFYDLPEILPANSVIIRNNTKVMPARILGQKATGGQVEILLIKQVESTKGNVWQCLTKPGLKVGQQIVFADSHLKAECINVTNYTREIKFNLVGEEFFREIFKIGHTPIPPYITQWSEEDEPHLRQVYQTLYAKILGSAAAPTAGLHFTSELDQKLIDKGIKILELSLHVGLGTFLRVKTDEIENHQMHFEEYQLTRDVADQINRAKTDGQPIVAVGTTTTRVLETLADDKGQIHPGQGQTNLFIYPPRQFNIVDHLITNFHEPKSTLLMLISAFDSFPNTDRKFTSFAEAGIGKAYSEAIKENYRMLSFGDGMIILPQLQI